MMPARTISVAAIGTLTVTTKHNGDECRHARRQRVPDEHVLQGVDGVGRRRDPAGQCAGHPIGEVAQRVPGQVAEQIAAHVASDPDEDGAGDPAGQPPQQIVRSDQRRQEEKPQPCVCDIARDASRQDVDENLDAVLGPNRATHGRHHRHQDDCMRYRPHHHVTGEKRTGTIRVPTGIVHMVLGTLAPTTRTSLNGATRDARHGPMRDARHGSNGTCL
jgi:hypothetical protein